METPSEASPQSSRRAIRIVAFVLPGVLFIALLTFAVAGKGGGLEPGDRAPDFSAPLLMSEGEMSLGELKGTPVVLNFWASWCGPCKDEAPLLSEAARRYEGRIAFVGVDVKDARTDAIAFARDYGLDYPHVRDEDSSIYAAYGLTGQPETFFISASGRIVEHIPGPLFEPDLQILLDRLTADG